MAQKNSGTKISELAKNFKLKNKEVIDILEESGVVGKTHTATLEQHELNVFLENLTKKNEASNEELAAFWNRTKPAPEEKKIEVSAKASDKGDKSEKTPKAEPAAKAETNTEEKPEVKAENKPEPKKEEPKEEIKAEAKAEAKAEVKAEEKVEKVIDNKPSEKEETTSETKPVSDGEKQKPNQNDNASRPNVGSVGSARNQDDRKPNDGQKSFGDKKP